MNTLTPEMLAALNAAGWDVQGTRYGHRLLHPEGVSVYAAGGRVRALLADVQAHGVTVVTATRHLKHVEVTGRTVTLRGGQIDIGGACTTSECRRRGPET